MEQLRYFFDLFMHLDKHLNDVIQAYGVWTYSLLFAIVFCETGLVVTPILPGDSLLFAAGTLSRSGPLSPVLLFLLLSAAAILGDTINYQIGHFVGPKVFRGGSRFFKKEYLDRTHRFYEKYGGKTIILARFVPIIRTFAPFVAGIGAMSYLRFLAYNVIGGASWVAAFVFAGYGFANLPVVRDRFSLVILAIIIISIMPGVIEFLRARYGKDAAAAPPALGADCPDRKNARDETVT